MSGRRVVCSLVLLALLAALLLAVGTGGCTKPEGASGPQTWGVTTSGSSPTTLPTRADGYVVLVPRVLRSGGPASFSVTLTDGTLPGVGPAKIALTRDDKVLARGEAGIRGTGTVELDIPPLAPGDYKLLVQAAGFSDESLVRVEASTLLFLETDKPIYKPGQTVKMRLVALDGELKPVQVQATVEVQDAKGIKVFKEVLNTDQYGMADTELPLSAEPNLGVWKLSALCGDASTEVDVRVEKYVLPKYEVSATLARDWFLVDEPITGHVTAKYSYGRKVKGELRVTASRYVGEWEQYATYSARIDGEGEFTIKPAGYVAGVAEAGGNGNVRLDIAVVEDSTGYEQSATELLTVAQSPVTIRLIPESSTFKPTLPFTLLVATKTPGGQPVESSVKLEVYYQGEDFTDKGHETLRVETQRGMGLVRVTPPEGAARLMVQAEVGDAHAETSVSAAYSPSGSFVHVQQVGDLDLSVGERAQFTVASTAQAGTFYYEVVARGRVLFTSTAGSEISFAVTPTMTPSARLLVYQILPTGEVAADALPFEVRGDYPQQVGVSFDVTEAAPGQQVELRVQTEGPAKVGVTAVDHSVFILAENRLNLEQVFAELERLYMKPQAELHEAVWEGWPLSLPGAKEVFEEAGLVVLSNKEVPEGKQLEPHRLFEGLVLGPGPLKAEGNVTTTTAAGLVPGYVTGRGEQAQAGDLAEVQRVRQFFPETWIWTETTTDDSGQATLSFEAPDSITNWDLRAVAVSPTKGLGVAETSLTVFQPFFLSADLPYSAIRGEEFPVKITLYNYLDTPQWIQVELEKSEWFELLGDPVATVWVAGGEVGSAQFRIRPKTIGTQLLEVSARSAEAADAVVKSMIVEPEGVTREQVVNLVLPAGETRTLELPLPGIVPVVPDSERAYVAITGSLLAQTIDGLDQLLQMPFGCGEQNMILFAPDAFILKYLETTRQLKPEVRAKAELLLTTGYQRELTYRHADGSFSAFGESDESGSLWLTAFVLKTFAQAKRLTFIDETVLSQAAEWITRQQQADGSFESVGFVCHSEMMGGVQGKDTLTAYVAIALSEAGYDAAAGKAVSYLEKRLDKITDAYSLALVTCALELAGSERAPEAMRALMAQAIADEEGLHWSAGRGGPEASGSGGPEGGFQPGVPLVSSLDVEATAYGALALMAAGDKVSAGQAARWLVGRRNSQGGFGTTQDTVVALQALTEYAALATSDTEMTVAVESGGKSQEVNLDRENFDVTQVIEIPAGQSVRLTARGRGTVVVQGVVRYNLPQAEKEKSVFDIKVKYDTAQVAVNDVLDIDVSIRFDPPVPVKAGMTVLDVSVPTGFAPVEESLAVLLEQARIKRYEMAGRKVIFYIEDMKPGDTVTFRFQAVALYPVRAKGAVSQVYSYYTPEWRGETVGASLEVR